MHRRHRVVHYGVPTLTDVGHGCMTLFDTIYANIDSFRTLDEIQRFAEAEFDRRRIQAIHTNPEDTHEDWIDSDDYVHTDHFYRALADDPRCPKWLSQTIVWNVLKR